MKRPVIGVTAQRKSDGSLCIGKAYREAIIASGGTPLMLSGGDKVPADCDGVLFTGGPDVDPSAYGEEILPTAHVKTSRERDAAEIPLARSVYASQMPTLAVCRGFQVVNVALGGTLYQDVNVQGVTDFVHCVPSADPDFKVHDVSVERLSPLAGIVGAETLAVNSRHHQAVKKLAPLLRAAANAPDGIVEAAYAEGLPFFIGVQWHPETTFPSDEASRRLFTAFIKAAAKA